MIVRELELDLDAFDGPFDLLLTLVLKEELDLREVDVAGIVLAFLERGDVLGDLAVLAGELVDAVLPRPRLLRQVAERNREVQRILGPVQQ